MSVELRKQVGLLSPEEIATMLEVTAHTLAQWRAEKRGPAYVRLGRNVFYRLADVQAWIDDSVCAAGRPTVEGNEG